MSLASKGIVDYCIWFSNFHRSLLDDHNCRVHLGSCCLEVISLGYMAMPCTNCFEPEIDNTFEKCVVCITIGVAKGGPPIEF